MIYDENYDYKLISENYFNEKFLLSSNDGSKYKKYIFIYYKDNDEIKNVQLPDETYLDRFNNILSKYEVEEIISSCENFDGHFDYKHYYNIKNQFCFIKYIIDEDLDYLIPNNDNEEVKELLNNLKK